MAAIASPSLSIGIITGSHPSACDAVTAKAKARRVLLRMASVSVRLSDGSKLDVVVPDLDAGTVLSLKEQISAALSDKPLASTLKSVFKGKVRVQHGTGGGGRARDPAAGRRCCRGGRASVR